MGYVCTPVFFSNFDLEKKKEKNADPESLPEGSISCVLCGNSSQCPTKMKSPEATLRYENTLATEEERVYRQLWVRLFRRIHSFVVLHF